MALPSPREEAGRERHLPALSVVLVKLRQASNFGLRRNVSNTDEGTSSATFKQQKVISAVHAALQVLTVASIGNMTA
jgi:hypothetical protein